MEVTRRGILFASDCLAALQARGHSIDLSDHVVPLVTLPDGAILIWGDKDSLLPGYHLLKSLNEIANEGLESFEYRQQHLNQIQCVFRWPDATHAAVMAVWTLFRDAAKDQECFVEFDCLPDAKCWHLELNCYGRVRRDLHVLISNSCSATIQQFMARNPDDRVELCAITFGQRGYAIDLQTSAMRSDNLMQLVYELYKLSSIVPIREILGKVSP